MEEKNGGVSIEGLLVYDEEEGPSIQIAEGLDNMEFRTPLSTILKPVLGQWVKITAKIL